MGYDRMSEGHCPIVAIRVDASSIMGSGHLMRCLTLAKRWQREKNAEVHFISRDLEGNLFSLIEKNGFFLHRLPRHETNENLFGYAAWLTVSQQEDSEETKAVLQTLGVIDCLVVDHYGLDVAWESQMRPLVSKIFVIDDLANRKHDCDILLDQNFQIDGEARYKGLVPEHCELRVGIKYLLLREEFYEAKKHIRKRDGNIKHFFVFYGGSDSTNETMKALQALTMLPLQDISADVVVGLGNPHREEVEAFCKRYDFLHYHCQVDNMAELINKADLALGAGGSTTWERCFLQLPALVTSVADNQGGGELCQREYVFRYLGDWRSVTSDDICRTIQDIMRDKRDYFMMVEKAKQLFPEGEC